MKLINILITEENLGLKLVPGIVSAIDDVDANLNYKDFAQAIAQVLKDEYGTHNLQPFMDELHAYLGMQENVEEGFQTMDVNDIAAEFAKNFPSLDFNVSRQGDRIDVRGPQQAMADFGYEYDGQVVGDFEITHTDDDERGEIVRFVKSSSIHRAE